MARFLKNPKTGQIVRSNPVLEERMDLRPCSAPYEEPEKAEFVSVVPEDESSKRMSNPEKPPLEPKKQPKENSDDALVSQEEGTALIMKWFNKGVGDVSRNDIKDYAKEHTGQNIPANISKLEMVTRLNRFLEESK